MSTSPHAPEHPHAPTHGAHGSRTSYRVGSLLSIVLTAIPFLLVMTDVLPDRGIIAPIIFALGFIQIIVHVLSFLHLDTRSEGGWTLLAFLFTTVIVVLTIAGSIWVMYHLNANMMPMPGGPMDGSTH